MTLVIRTTTGTEHFYRNMPGECKTLVQHNIDHVRQRFHWDCGVTCVLMLLDPETRRNAFKNFERICYEEGFGQSTWTIDLCYLLKRFNIDHTMYTIHAGVNDEYIHQKYYSRIINNDRARVVQRFSEAPKLGIKCVVGSLTHGDLLTLLQRGPVVLLVDRARLVPPDLITQLGCCLGTSYTGHYILLTGYDTSRGVFLYLEPAGRAVLSTVPYRRLHEARTALGTDHDAIAVCMTS